MSHIEVILETLSSHPRCPHGPTILFNRVASDGSFVKFYACSACRDRKGCAFYLNENDLSNVSKTKQTLWKKRNEQFVRGLNHRKLYITLNQVKQLDSGLRRYCKSCNLFVDKKFEEKHIAHDIMKGLDDYILSNPSEFLPPLENPKEEAQFLFTRDTVETIVNILKEKDFKNVICLGAPKIHEYIQDKCDTMNSILLDIDKRYHGFFGPLQFCWYNMFNHHFFLEGAENVFKDFILNSKNNLVLVTDPPFGCRVELLAHSLGQIDSLNKSLNKTNESLPIMWFFPYFMEPQVVNSLPSFLMLDYKVDYINHPLFQRAPKGRKLGSPVRIFTNINASSIKLPEENGYRYCEICKRWVSKENKHCNLCKSCPSKDGSMYLHCKQCKRCVKPTWLHCETCQRCAQKDHTCKDLPFIQACFHCKQPGHKKRECPKVNQEDLRIKRKKKAENKNIKKIKLNA